MPRSACTKWPLSIPWFVAGCRRCLDVSVVLSGLCCDVCFHPQFNRTAVGKYHLQVCGTTPCQLCGFENIRDTITKHLGIKVGGE